MSFLLLNQFCLSYIDTGGHDNVYEDLQNLFLDSPLRQKPAITRKTKMTTREENQPLPLPQRVC